jgi:O-methyltransferase
MRAVRNSPRHLARIAKSYAVLGYSSALHWAEERQRRLDATRREEQEQQLERQRQMDAASREAKRQDGCCFSSHYISIPAAMENMNHLSRGYRDEARIKDFVRQIVGHTMVPYDGIATLVDQVRYCEENNVAGDYVELGTWKGGCLASMALANLAYGRQRRTIHGFDSFEGIPMPRRDKDDMEWSRVEMRLTDEDCDGRLEPAGQLIGPRADVEALLARIGYPADFIHLHQGWFQDTVPVAKIDQIAILRMDGDLYDSYVVPLEYLYDRVSPGGFIIFDDWVLEGCRRAVTEFFERRNMRPYLCHVDESIRYFQKPADAGPAGGGRPGEGSAGRL